MKIRFAFISNSSSMNFMVNLKHFSPEIQEKLLHLDRTAIELQHERQELQTDNEYITEITNYYEEWEFEQHGTVLKGVATMDNLEMHELFTKIWKQYGLSNRHFPIIFHHIWHQNPDPFWLARLKLTREHIRNYIRWKRFRWKEFKWKNRKINDLHLI